MIQLNHFLIIPSQTIHPLPIIIKTNKCLFAVYNLNLWHVILKILILLRQVQYILNIDPHESGNIRIDGEWVLKNQIIDCVFKFRIIFIGIFYRL